MARTPAYVDIHHEDDGISIILVCDTCEDTIYVAGPEDIANFIAMTDAHDEHADKVHGEGV